MINQEKIECFAALVTRHQRDRLKKEYPSIFASQPDYADARIKPGKKYTKVDVGRSGKFMVDAEGNIFGIKGYCVIHRGKKYGTLDTIAKYFWGHYNPIRLPD